ncbi:HEPN domain-containing protein [Rathayibacter sp. PhB152]|uniref:HEPN domain-containing protein n=1 Tax=Rathayibacter sp. PhB152 TaxID=2485190 RepID=UPI000F4CCCF9|nr:HEPN domain-containing protein [Rathayibacter sp. PhB152]ROQ56049.1 HEPN domain-containing protein [Rathayibacter sp. PhB152]
MSGVLRWEKGRDTVDALLTARRMEQVPANREHAERLIEQARRHVLSAERVREDDLELAFSAAYDAARKALTAVFAIQGLRPTSQGGHVAVSEAARAQFDPPMGRVVTRFEWMRRTRNAAEYPQIGAPEIDVDEVSDAIASATQMLDFAVTVLDVLPPYRK